MTVVPLHTARTRSRTFSALRPIDVAWFEAVKELLKNSDVADREEFSQLVGAIVSRLGTVDSMAHAFGVSPATLSRWISGSNLPPVYARDGVLGKLSELIDTQLETIKESA